MVLEKMNVLPGKRSAGKSTINKKRARTSSSSGPDGGKKTSSTQKGKFSSGYRFVYKAGKRWQVRLKRKKECIYVGVFNSAEDGARAADAKVRELRWPSELLNFANDTLKRPVPRPAVVGRINIHPQPRSTNALGYRGVFSHKTKSRTRYTAQVWKNSKAYNVRGSFDTIEEAARARDKLAVKLGRTAEFLNFPEEYEAHKRHLHAIDSSDDKQLNSKAVRLRNLSGKNNLGLSPSSSSEEDSDDEIIDIKRRKPSNDGRLLRGAMPSSMPSYSMSL